MLLSRKMIINIHKPLDFEVFSDKPVSILVFSCFCHPHPHRPWIQTDPSGRRLCGTAPATVWRPPTARPIRSAKLGDLASVFGFGLWPLPEAPKKKDGNPIKKHGQDPWNHSEKMKDLRYRWISVVRVKLWNHQQWISFPREFARKAMGRGPWIAPSLIPDLHRRRKELVHGPLNKTGAIPVGGINESMGSWKAQVMVWDVYILISTWHGILIWRRGTWTSSRQQDGF
jgi:hypothetical protein